MVNAPLKLWVPAKMYIQTLQVLGPRFKEAGSLHINVSKLHCIVDPIWLITLVSQSANNLSTIHSLHSPYEMGETQDSYIKIIFI